MGEKYDHLRRHCDPDSVATDALIPIKTLRALLADYDDALTRLDRMRRHAISDPEMRALHESAKAYSLAVQALNAKRGGPLSTTLAFLIEQDYLVPNDPTRPPS